MNQKNLIVILAIIILALTGAVGYFMVTKTAVPQSQNKNVSQNSQSQQPQVNKNTIPQANNLTKINELEIEIEFLDGYKLIEDGETGKTFILFGPLGKELSPNPQEAEDVHIYQLSAVEKRTTAEIVYLAKNGVGPMSFEPKIEMINNVEVVKWVLGGYCENRTMEVVGTKMNYIFSSMGCHKDQKFDFDYFEKTIKTIKFL